MAHRKVLNEKQLAVLRWVAEGCPKGVMDGPSHRITAAALRARGFMQTSGRGATWRAQTTRAGRDYLKRADGPDAPLPRQASISVTEQLVGDVVSAGGSLRVPRRHYFDRKGVDYERRARLAERYGKLPEGKRLDVTAISAEELQIDLVDAPAGTAVAARPVPVPARVARYHPIVGRFKELDERHEVSRAVLPRVLRILQALAVEAERRGHRLEISSPQQRRAYGRPSWTGARDGHVVVTAGECAAALRVTEQGLMSRAHWATHISPYAYGEGDGWRAIRRPLTEYEPGATGRLSIELVTGHSERGRPAKWSDRRAWSLEEKLPEVLREIEIRAAERRHRQRAAELEAAERERARQAALARARERHAEAKRAEALMDEVRRWSAAREIRSYCDAAGRAHPDEPGTLEWISWARNHADELDPLTAAPRAPARPAAVPVEELRPFLRPSADERTAFDVGPGRSRAGPRLD